MSRWKVYIYDKCSTCQKAVKWLDSQGIPYELKAIRETPPSVQELKKAVAHMGSIRKVFNTSGLDYRQLNLKEKLPEMSEQEALSLLSQNGNLVKRPFVVDGNRAWTGFKESFWSEQLAG